MVLWAESGKGIMRSVTSEPSPKLAETDRGPRSPPRAVGSALRRGDACLRLLLGLSWLALAGIPPFDRTGLSATGLRVALGLSGALVLAGLVPRTSTAVGLALSLVAAGEQASSFGGLALAGGAGVRLAGWLHGAGVWLGRVRALEVQRAFALAATQLGRRRAREGSSESRRAAAHSDAGDAYERAGALASALDELGAEPALATRLAGPAGAGLGFVLLPLPDLRRRLEQDLARRAGLPVPP
jgi:hypothetical protein